MCDLFSHSSNALILYVLHKSSPDIQTLEATLWAFGLALWVVILVAFARAPWKVYQDQEKVHRERDAERQKEIARLAELNAQKDAYIQKIKSGRPQLAVKIVALYVQARFNPEYSQVAEWIKQHEIPLQNAVAIGRLIETGDVIQLQSYQPLLADLIIRCDVFLHVQITSDHPEPIKVKGYQLQALLYGADAHVAWWSGGLGEWKIATVVHPCRTGHGS
jgi:hypothetical protein